MRRLGNILALGLKELRVLRADPVMVVLLLYTFTLAVYAVTTGVKMEVRNAAIGVVDEDQSDLSRALRAALLPPQFRAPVALSPEQVTPALDSGRLVFVLQVPPRFEADLLARRPAELALDVDATAMSMAGNGSAYIQEIVQQEVAGRVGAVAWPVEVVLRTRFNPNSTPEWFSAVMQVVNSIMMLSIILPGAALLREREHGTLEHLLAMPVTPLEILLAKVAANALVIVGAAVLSLVFVVQGLLAVPLAGSLPLFVLGTLLFQVSIAGLGILLATASASTGQFGLLALPLLILLMLLSGSMTPLESMPGWLQQVVQISPAVQFVSFAQAVLYRGASLRIVAPQLLALLLLGATFLGMALLRLRRSLARAG